MDTKEAYDMHNAYSDAAVREAVLGMVAVYREDARQGQGGGGNGRAVMAMAETFCVVAPSSVLWRPLLVIDRSTLK